MIARRSVSRTIRLTLLVAGVLLMLAHASGVWPLRFVTQLDHAYTDARLRATAEGTLDERIVIVDIDQVSLNQIGRWPWPRDRLADLVDALFDREGAAVVGFDMLLTEADATATGADGRLAAALQARAAVLGFYFDNAQGAARTGLLPPPLFDAVPPNGARSPLTRWPSYTAPLPALGRATARAGFINSLPDEDGVVRSMPLIADHDGRAYPSLALAMFMLHAGQPEVEPVWGAGERGPGSAAALDQLTLAQAGQRQAIRVGERAAVRVPYRGPGGRAGGSFVHVPAADVLLGRLAPGALRGRLVIVGSTAPALFDLRPTPVGEVYPGVEIHASVLSGLLDGRLPVRPDWARGAEMAQLLVLGLVLALALPRLGAAAALLLALGVLAGVVSLNLWMYVAHAVDLPLAASLMLVALLYGGTAVWGHIREAHTRRSLTRLFGAYVPPELVREMARDPGRHDMHAEDRVMTIMFCDMRNFTRIAENMPPEALRALINRFFSTMTAAIHGQRGTLDKYIGDAIMAFWGAPLEDDRHAEHAVRAALEMVRRMHTLNDELRAQGLPALGLGIGLNTGLVCVGDMGSDIRRSYTVMGDAVNLASRIESLTRHYGLDLLVGQATRDAVETPDLRWVEIDLVRVKGKQQAVTLFTPVDTARASLPAFDEEMRLWRLAHEQHRTQHWAAADTALSELRSRFPESTFAGLYQHYSERNNHYRITPPPPGWDSAHSFDSK